MPGLWNRYIPYPWYRITIEKSRIEDTMINNTSKKLVKSENISRQHTNKADLTKQKINWYKRDTCTENKNSEKAWKIFPITKFFFCFVFSVLGMNVLANADVRDLKFCTQNKNATINANNINELIYAKHDERQHHNCIKDTIIINYVSNLVAISSQRSQI